MKYIRLSSTVASLLSITALCTMFLAAASKASAKDLYLAPGVWASDQAKFAIYYFKNDQDKGWSQYMTSVNADVYKGTIPDGYSKVIFCRMDPQKGIDWAGKWNQTDDLTIPSDKNQYNITDWGSNTSPGEWSVYGQDPTPPTEEQQDYASAVPAECTDIMLQAFYWQSNSDNTYGTSQWTVLKNQADEINAYFDLVWLPPSCNSNDVMGYLPKMYYNQNCTMGQVATLKRLISAFHSGNTKVLADVVINHAANRSSWIDFEEQDFGEYGYFKPKSTWITSNDEAQGKGKLGNNADDGQENNANYPSARDWDHKNDSVKMMCRAYLKFLKYTMKYDGFRFDYCGGYHVSHVSDYVSAAKPYFSVMEYWNGNASVLKSRIDNASKNTLTFDFAAFHTGFQQGIASNSYDKLKSLGLRGVGYSKYAVTFVDNHDTFNRSDINNKDCGNSTDGHTSLANRALILQCNAYILSMPGVPCVFWPHWYTYKSEIKAMINARKAAGIHSESTVESETSGSGWYKATIVGKNGKVVLYLGSAASETAPSGFKQAIKENKVAVYYTGNESWDVTNVESDQIQSTKFIENGQFFIRRGEHVFDSQGRRLY